MNYRQLRDILTFEMTDEQLDQTATVYIPGVDEYYPLHDNLTIVCEDDVLDKGHIVLTIA